MAVFRSSSGCILKFCGLSCEVCLYSRNSKVATAMGTVERAKCSKPRGGISFPSLENAIQSILRRFYAGQNPLTTPISQQTPEQTERNAEIRTQHAAGKTVKELAKAYRISIKRIYQILHMKW